MIRHAMLISPLLVALTAHASPQTQTTSPQSPSNTSQTKPAQPSGRPPIQAKTQDEFKAYQAAVSGAQTPDALEKAADDFAGKFPDSELRVLLYRVAMHNYQNAGNSQKMMDMGLKVLSIDRDDPEALIGVAEVQEEHTSPTDLDRDQRMTQAATNAQHALDTMDTDLAIPAGTPPEKVEAYKKYLRSTALSIIGTLQYKREQYADAEVNLRKAIETDAENPDAVIILRLALALDQEKKYPEALQQANRAVELTQETTDVGRMAREEKEHLVVQTGGNNTPASPPPAALPANGSQNPQAPSQSTQPPSQTPAPASQNPPPSSH